MFRYLHIDMSPIMWIMLRLGPCLSPEAAVEPHSTAMSSDVISLLACRPLQVLLKPEVAAGRLAEGERSNALLREPLLADMLGPCSGAQSM